MPRPPALPVLLALLGLALLGLAPAAGAQSGRDQNPEVVAADAALREGRPDEALQRIDAYLRTNADDAEAQYLAARILNADGPLQDERRAARALDRAVDLDPDNVVYLVAKLEGQRLERSNILLDLLRARRRYVLAQRILALDSTNAYAHEELGTWAIRDYYQYRNAISMPGLSYEAPAAGRNAAASVDERAGSGEVASETAGLAVKSSIGDEGFYDLGDANGVYAIDRFDIEQLRAQNVGIVTFEGRASRAYDAAIVHLRQALRSDPRRRSVYDHMVRLALISGRWDQVEANLREMYVQFPTDPGMWLYTGLAAQRTGRYDAADAAFTEALRYMPDAERDVFTDLALILPPDEVAAYRADRDAFAQRYWTSRDPRFLNGVNERRTEHFARLVEADLLYRSEALGRPGWTTERGLLHVRYGPPQTDVMIDGSFAQALETFQGADALFGQQSQYSGGETLPTNVGPSAAEASANRFNVWSYPDGLRLAFEDPNRNGQFRLYSPPAWSYALASARDPARMDFVQIARDAVRETPERYTYVPPGRQIELPYRVTAFKGQGARADLYVNYGIPLSEEAGTGDVDLTIQTGAFLVGAGRDLLAEHRRTIYGLRAAQIVPFAATRLWTATEPLVAPPGPNEVSVEFETAGGGASAVQRRAITVPDFSRAGLQMSDVMLAYAVDRGGAAAPGRVQRGGVSILAAPWGVFAAGQPVFLYAEVYGLTPRDGRTDFEVEARLVPKDTASGLRRLGRRIFGGATRGVASTAEAQGTSPDDSADLRLATEGQPPGLYTLTVTVRDRTTGATAERETDLLLEDPTEGATAAVAP